MPLIDICGQRFGRLVVINYSHSNKHRKSFWLCKCDCGNIKILRGNDLKSGKIQSCGCYNSERTISFNTTHGLSGTRLYRIWKNIKMRCLDPNKPDYKYYGGRGIKICDEWINNFKSFYDWAMSNGYKEALTIDRRENDGNYEPSNCRWVTMAAQNQNKHCLHKQIGA